MTISTPRPEPIPLYHLVTRDQLDAPVELKFDGYTVWLQPPFARMAPIWVGEFGRAICVGIKPAPVKVDAFVPFGDTMVRIAVPQDAGEPAWVTLEIPEDIPHEEVVVFPECGRYSRHYDGVGDLELRVLRF